MPTDKKQSELKPDFAAMTKRQKMKHFVHYFKATAGNIGAACDEIGITRRTFQYWIKEEAFKEQIEEIENQMIDNLESSVYSGALQNGELALKVLERLRPEKWKIKKDEAEGFGGTIVVKVEYTD